MSVLGDVFESLRAMSLVQLLLAFIACTGYALAQGGLVSTRARQISSAVAVLGAIGFAFQSAEWMYAAMLLAFAIAGMGVFVMLAWMISGLIGFVGARAFRNTGAASPLGMQLAHASDDVTLTDSAPLDASGAQMAGARSSQGRGVKVVQSA
jgi:hypothetical protein